VRDLAAFHSLPPAPYYACEKKTGRVSSLSLVRYRGTEYSVPTAYGHREILIRGYVHEVVISCGAEVIAHHPRSYEREDFVFDAHRGARAGGSDERGHLALCVTSLTIKGSPPARPAHYAVRIRLLGVDGARLARTALRTPQGASCIRCNEDRRERGLRAPPTAKRHPYIDRP
jgi:hypothetical protein